MSRDTTRQQIYEACDRQRIAAILLEYFMAIHELKRKRHPGAQPGSSELLMDFTYADLAEKHLTSISSVKRSIGYLVSRRFICKHPGIGFNRTSLYELNSALVATIFQSLPLFESHEFTMTSSMRSPWPHASAHHDPFDEVTMTSSYSLPSLTSSQHHHQQGVADAEEVDTEEARPAPAVVLEHAEPHQRHAEADGDADRDDLLEQLRGIGIAKEHAEAHLTRHTRQKIQAALACLARDRRQRVIQSDAGYVLGFLADPGRYGYELDLQGCWRSSKDLAREEKLRRQARTRDSPSGDARQAAFIAWDRLSTPEQQAIRQALQQSHPDISPGLLMQRCREQALATTTTREAPCPPP
jgi:hypothetical protein